MDFLLFLLGIHSSEKHGIKTQISSKSSITFRDSKRVNLPGDLWLLFNSNLFHQKSMTSHEVVNNIIVTCTCLIRSWPSSIDNIELFILYELPYRISFCLILFLPPHLEELHFGICECLIFVFFKSSYYCREHIMDGTKIKVKIFSIKILLESWQPSQVCMGVWKNM